MSTIGSLAYFQPELALMIGGCVVLFSDFIFKNKQNITRLAFVFTIIAALLIKKPESPMILFSGYVIIDSMTHVFRWMSIGIIGITLLLSLGYKQLMEKYLGEYNALFLWMASALILMASARNLLLVFLSIEFVSLVSYLLVGFLKTNPKSKEASLKYLLFGSFCSGMMLYGMSLLYGYTGSLDLQGIHAQITNPGSSKLVFLSLILIFTGVGFKISMAPFHMWAPDVYEGAPTPVTAFLTVGPKALGFAVLMRILSTVFIDYFPTWTQIILLLSILTMTIGNVIALSQTNIKRFIAYSSIAQAGYILMGIAAFGNIGAQGVMIYLIAYAFTNLGIFAIILSVSESGQGESIQSYAGLSTKAPFLAASFTIFLLSLAGIPPLAGFIGKFYVFAATIEKGYTMLAVAAAINSVVAAFYYFKIVRLMYLVPAESEVKPAFSLPLKISLALMLAGTVLLGVMPKIVISFIS